jgi:hypothetical protein
MLETTQLALDYFNSQLVQEISQFFPGNSQFFSQTKGGATGNLALRGCCPNFAFHIIFGHIS